MANGDTLPMLGADTETKLGGLLGLSGIACTVIGLIAVVSPTSTASQFGYNFASLGGQGEFMTFYGGFYAGIGPFLLAAVRVRSLRPGAVAFLACSATAAIPVRVYSLVQFDVTAVAFYELLFREILFATAGWVG